MPTLVIESSDGNRLAFRLEAGKRWLVGTDPRCSLRLPPGSAEPFHCEFFCSSLRWQVRDLLSASGTFVGGMAVSQQPLASGDVIEVGQQRLAFFLEDRPAASFPSSRAARAERTPARALSSAATASAAGKGSSVAQKHLASLVLVVGLAAAFAILSGALGPSST